MYFGWKKGCPHGTGSRWLGDSRRHWDGDTLVVDTTNFTTHTEAAGSDANLHVVERFTRVDADAIDYQFTVDDSTVWTRSWTAALRLHRTDEPIYEFACHEGNGLIMEDMLRVARMPETP